MREHLTLTKTSRRWITVGIVVTTAAVTIMTLLHTVEHNIAWLAASITVAVMIGFPAVAFFHVHRLRRAGEDVAADAVLSLTLGGVISLYLVWTTGSLSP